MPDRGMISTLLAVWGYLLIFFGGAILIFLSLTLLPFTPLLVNITIQSPSIDPNAFFLLLLLIPSIILSIIGSAWAMGSGTLTILWADDPSAHKYSLIILAITQFPFGIIAIPGILILLTALFIPS